MAGKLSLFDCNCMIGRRAQRREGEPWSADQLLADMETCGISEALVTTAGQLLRSALPSTPARDSLVALGPYVTRRHH